MITKFLVLEQRFKIALGNASADVWETIGHRLIAIANDDLGQRRNRHAFAPY